MDTVETQVVNTSAVPVEEVEEKDEIPPSQPRSPVELPPNNHPDLPVDSKVGNVFLYLGLARVLTISVPRDLVCTIKHHIKCVTHIIR